MQLIIIIAGIAALLLSIIIGALIYFLIQRSPKKNILVEIMPDNTFKLHKRKSFAGQLVTIKKPDGEFEAYEINPEAVYSFFPNKRVMFVKSGYPAPLKLDFNFNSIRYTPLTAENLLKLVNSAHVSKVASGSAPKITPIEIGIGIMVLIILIINVLIASKIFEVIK